MKLLFLFISDLRLFHQFNKIIVRPVDYIQYGLQVTTTTFKWLVFVIKRMTIMNIFEFLLNISKYLILQGNCQSFDLPVGFSLYIKSLLLYCPKY